MGDCLLSIEQKFKDNVSLRCILCTFKGKRAKKKKKNKTQRGSFGGVVKPCSLQRHNSPTRV